uniref:Uncharacterized protein n=1 Tax=viral metagenome TaxID=1070528 RepID=A0A6M3KXR9_9ZZZZ
MPNEKSPYLPQDDRVASIVLSYAVNLMCSLDKKVGADQTPLDAALNTMRIANLLLRWLVPKAEEFAHALSGLQIEKGLITHTEAITLYRDCLCNGELFAEKLQTIIEERRTS